MKSKIVNVRLSIEEFYDLMHSDFVKNKGYFYLDSNENGEVTARLNINKDVGESINEYPGIKEWVIITQKT